MPYVLASVSRSLSRADRSDLDAWRFGGTLWRWLYPLSSTPPHPIPPNTCYTFPQPGTGGGGSALQMGCAGPQQAVDDRGGGTCWLRLVEADPIDGPGAVYRTVFCAFVTWMGWHSQAGPAGRPPSESAHTRDAACRPDPAPWAGTALHCAS